MRPQSIFLAVAAGVIFGFTACSQSPGRPGPNSEVIAHREIMAFNFLYSHNCAGCHGAGGRGGAAFALADPVFLAIADDAAIRHSAALGVSGTAMPAFAQSAGGMLTDMQIDVVVAGIRSWAKPDILRDANPPPYSAQTPSDSKRGAAVYATYCSSCHGADGRGGKKASSIVAGAYLALVSDQQLRTMVIVGRPELDAPDWRADVPGKPMSAQEISDVVAWLASQRPQSGGPSHQDPARTVAAGGLP